MGAHIAIDHFSRSYLDQIPGLTSGRGVDVVIEMLANINLESDFKALAKLGRIVVVGSRGIIEFKPRLAMIKVADILDMAVWNTTHEEYLSGLSAVAAALESGVLRPVVGRELSLEQAAQAPVDILKTGAGRKMVRTIE
jgi:NADPH2:quinone reductase